MNASFDTAGVFFSVLVIVGTIPIALRFLREAANDAVTTFAGRTLVIAAIANGIINVIRSMGRMPDDPTYQTLHIASLVVWGAMFWIALTRDRRRWARHTSPDR
ncbi:MAG: hypothetical protein ACREMS_11860 [Gemmatimonadaceae bacterium]